MGLAQYAIVPVHGQWGVLQAPFRQFPASDSLSFYGTHPATSAFPRRGCLMDRKRARKPVTPDRGDRTDWGSHAQTHEPWKGKSEKEQRSDNDKLDLEKWHESKTH